MATFNGDGTTNPRQGSQVQVVADVIRYVKTDDSGWLRVAQDGGSDGSLCEYTKVMLLGESGGRVKFKVMDSGKRGMVASLKKENADRFLGKEAPIQGEAVLNVSGRHRQNGWYSAPRGQSLDQELATVTYSGGSAQTSLNSDWDGSYSPIPPGTYRIRVPDTPHRGDYTRFYRDSAPGLRYDQVWFPIEYGNNSRYVHVGHLSEGCVTIISLDQWTSLYKYLIKHRTADGDHVGKVVAGR